MPGAGKHRPQTLPFLVIDEETWLELGSPNHDLLGQPAPAIKKVEDGVELFLEAAECYCLTDRLEPKGLAGDTYRELRAQAAWAITMITRRIRVRDISPFDWKQMAALVQAGAREFLSAVTHLEPALVKEDVLAALKLATAVSRFPSSRHMGYRGAPARHARTAGSLAAHLGRCPVPRGAPAGCQGCARTPRVIAHRLPAM